VNRVHPMTNVYHSTPSVRHLLHASVPAMKRSLGVDPTAVRVLR